MNKNGFTNDDVLDLIKIGLVLIAAYIIIKAIQSAI